MSAAENKALVRRMMEEVLLRGQAELIDEFFSADFVQFGRRVGPGQFKTLVTTLHAAFPDLQGTIEHLVAEEDLVVTEVTVRGTQHGPFPFPQVGILPPTGKSYTVKHCHWWRVVDGKIAEHGAVRDDLGQLTQLGHLSLPTPRAT